MWPHGADREEKKKKSDVKRSVARLYVYPTRETIAFRRLLPPTPTPHLCHLLAPRTTSRPNRHYRRRLSSSLSRRLIEFADSVVGTSARDVHPPPIGGGCGGAREFTAHTTSVPVTNIRRSRHRHRRHTCPSMSIPGPRNFGIISYVRA